MLPLGAIWLGELCILSTLDLHRRKVMTRTKARQQHAGVEWVTTVPLVIQGKLNKFIEEARYVSVTWLGDDDDV